VANDAGRKSDRRWQQSLASSARSNQQVDLDEADAPSVGPRAQRQRWNSFWHYPKFPFGGAAMNLSINAPFARRLAFAVFLVMSRILTGIAQAPAAQFVASDHATVKDFAGTWNWMYKDKRFATMILNVKDSQLEGTVTNEWMSMNDQGRITGAERRPGSSVITKAAVNNGKLSIVEKTGEEELNWAMTLTSSTTAELRIVGEGAPPNAEPIRLEKVWSEPPVEK
jgi:hypothetical protein